MDSLRKVIQGHEIWVLAEGSHGHPGHRVAGRVFYGHAMHPDGLADLARLKALAVGPGQETAEVSFEEGKRDFHLVVFTPEREGVWTLAVEYDVGPLVITRDGQYKRGTRRDYPDARKAAYYYQFAKTYIPVGYLGHERGHGHGHQHGYHELADHSHCGFNQPQPVPHQHGHNHGHHHHRDGFSFLGHQLEIAAWPGFCRKGQEVTIEVRYRGLPLLDANLCTTWSFYEKRRYPYQVKTGPDGRAVIPLRAEGHWLFYVRHEDSQVAREGEYDQKIYSATLTIFGVR
ncbi:Nickel transport complex protein, NikM subunit, transmembrane [Desulfofundulus kuznetsovii DSM 6115]|uniref:Nickel transport complex protein, NikM subunit, transmembrane n=1 Tax=Desulfofundulus kuznetsovii (strain DSM 6115 / VKM B-1805 / 17) TaxID=760568 RepID=A0AAU8P7R9_DESK7|nr:Nickel transport complex protein, NikM subunit, transmembrane [Desulfofundulus kuznetsovii DSM 6115]